MIQFLNSHPVLPSGAKIPLSTAAIAGDWVFLSGQLALDENWTLVEGDIGQQTQTALANIKKQLQQCGASLEQVVKVTVWLSKAADFPAFNQAYGEVFRERPPTRSTVVSELLIPGALVEIEAIACLSA